MRLICGFFKWLALLQLLAQSQVSTSRNIMVFAGQSIPIENNSPCQFNIIWKTVNNLQICLSRVQQLSVTKLSNRFVAFSVVVNDSGT